MRCHDVLLLLLAACCLPLAAQGQSAPIIAGLQCPSNVISVAAGTDLSSLFPASNTTFLLAPGQYTVSQPITPNALFEGATSLFNATVCFSGQGDTGADVFVQVQLTGLGPEVLGGNTAFTVERDRSGIGQPTQLGLQRLTLDGAAQFSGVQVFERSLLTAEDVIMQNMASDASRQDFSGSALAVDGGTARLSGVQFLDNAATSGGAVFCGSFSDRLTTLQLDKVTFLRNRALDFGGAMLVTNWCTVNFTGETVFRDNFVAGFEEGSTAVQLGGAIYILANLPPGVPEVATLEPAARVFFNGPLCAQDNHALNGGGFASILGNALLQFNDPFTASLNNNTRDDIVVLRAKNLIPGDDPPPRVIVPKVVCGPDSTARAWREGAYRISGPVCACNEDFVSGESEECLATCELGFDSDLCKCRTQCTNLGEGCCDKSGAIKSSGFVCRPAAGACDVAESCDGVLPTCPTDSVKPANFVCRASAGECDLEETCDGRTAECPADRFKPAKAPCKTAKECGSTTSRRDGLVKLGSCNGTSPACATSQSDKPLAPIDFPDAPGCP